MRLGSFEELVAESHAKLDAYKEDIEKLGLAATDKKKLLALPFFLAKRQ